MGGVYLYSTTAEFLQYKRLRQPQNILNAEISRSTVCQQFLCKEFSLMEEWLKTLSAYISLARVLHG